MSKFNKITRVGLLLSFFLLFGMGARADNVVTIGSAQGAPEEEVTIGIALENTTEVAALQVSMPIDGLLTYVEESATLTARADGHGVTAGVRNDTLNVMVYSLDMKPLLGSSGEVVTLRLRLGSQPCDIALAVTKLVATDTDGNALEATAQDGTVSIRCAKAQYSTMTVDFGHIPIRSTYQQNVMVTNIGNEPLTLTGVEFNRYPTKFGCSTEFPLTIAAGGSSTLTITYAPEVRGQVSETMKVVCNSISKLNTLTLTADPFAVNELHVQPASGIADDTISVSLRMNNMDAISGFQFEFTLPSQLTYVEHSFALTERKQNHSVVQTLTDGVLRIICYSVSDTPFTGEDGELATMQFRLSGRNSTTLKASKVVLTATIDNQVTNVFSADYGATITIRSPRINANSTLNMGATPITRDAESNYVVRNYGNAPLTLSRVLFDNEGFYIQEEMPLTIPANGNTTLHVVYPSMTEGYYATTMQIYSNDPEQRLWNVNVTGNRFAPNYFEISTEDVMESDSLSIDVSVNTYDPIVGLQFDLVYPSEHYEPFDNNYTLEPRAEGMSVTWRQIDSNTLRYFCYFIMGDGIAAGEGKVMSLILAPKNGRVPEGTYSVEVTDIMLGTSEMADKYAGNDDMSTFEVHAVLLGDVNRDKIQTDADVRALADIILGKDNAEPHLYNHAVADVNEDGVITLADVTTLVNIIRQLSYVKEDRGR